MRIALLISSLSPGGAEKNLAALADHFASSGHEVEILTFAPAGTPPGYPLDPRIRLTNLDLARGSRGVPSAIRNNLRRLRVLRAALRRAAPDAAISFGDQTNVACLLAGTGTGIPIIVSERIDPSAHPIGAAWRMLRRLAYSRAARIVVQADAFAECFPPRVRRRVVVIGNPVFLPPENPGGLRLPARTVLAAGRLDRQKGFDLLIPAFAAANAEQKGWSLWIFGEGPERESLEQLARKHGGDAIHLPGRTDQLPAAMAQAEIFALSSRYEGQPNVLAEAMLHGLPVVATDCPGVLGMLTPNVDGLLVERENEARLAEALERLMADASLRRSLGGAAPGIAKRFAPEAVFSRWDRLVAEVAPGRPGRPY